MAIIDIDGIKVNIRDEVYNLNDDIIKTRRYLHENPEPSLKEYNSARYIREFLESNNIEYFKVGETGTLGIIKGNKKVSNKTILLRADIDALEIEDKKNVSYSSKNQGLSHACGHDAHTSSLLYATKVLNSKKDEFSGTIKLCFQQAEEIGAGARIFVKEGYLDDVDFVFATHVDSSIQVGKIALVVGPQCASCDIFKIYIKGESAHASRPDLGKDAALATANIVTSLQNIISRQISPLTEGLITIGKIESGTRYNIIANDGYLEGTVRAFSKEVREYILKRVEEVSKLTAAIHNCEVTFENYDAAAPLINSKEETIYSQKVASFIVGIDNIITEREKSLGAEDFADFLAKVNGAYAKIGSQNINTSKYSYPHHHQNFDIDERALAIETDLYVSIALDYLKD